MLTRQTFVAPATGTSFTPPGVVDEPTTEGEGKIETPQDQVVRVTGETFRLLSHEPTRRLTTISVWDTGVPDVVCRIPTLSVFRGILSRPEVGLLSVGGLTFPSVSA